MKAIGSSLVFCAAALAMAAAAKAEDIQKGKALFIKQGCARCHGTEGQGGVGARIGVKPPSTEALIKYVRNPSGTMPPYRNQVTDAELADIRAYLASIPAPAAVKDIPLLNQ